MTLDDLDTHARYIFATVVTLCLVPIAIVVIVYQHIRWG